MAKKTKKTDAETPEAVSADVPQTPDAEGVAPDVSLLGPDELAEVLRKADEFDALEARWMRMQADLDNMKRRQVTERRSAAEDEAERVLAPVLDALDTFERAVDAAAESRDVDALLDGVRLAIREMERGLAEVGVRRVESMGETPNPDHHRVLMQQPTDEHPPMTIIGVLSHGWVRGERVLRPAQVTVAAPAAGGDGEA